jgi:hypothetical protein
MENFLVAASSVDQEEVLSKDDQVVRADIILSCFVAVENVAFLKVDSLVPTFKSMFTGNNILRSYNQ